MRVVHIKHFRRRAALLGIGVLSVTAAVFVLVGCLGREGGKDTATPIPAATEQQRQDYLTGLGWQIKPEPVETLTLQLPRELSESFGDYMALQNRQGLPFAQYGGQEVSRYTYVVCNYPDYAGDVQVNLFVCDGQVIGGDVVAMGENGFTRELAFPQ